MDSGACPAVDHQQQEPVPTMTTSPTDQQEDGGGGDCARCGESRSLDASLMEELNQQYERRLRIVEDHGDDLQFKVSAAAGAWPLPGGAVVDTDVKVTGARRRSTCPPHL